eukprot:TRINITY_DN7620_c0_g1_i1.p1 TRINITY_DN7620_c0_g1~~TRINITY_DN7620_c0_g1_i1.p1  ORF type:complete len:192 (+),score=49.46 TRINITY_DN7620_c0_g1_i1:50-577(+)
MEESSALQLPSIVLRLFCKHLDPYKRYRYRMYRNVPLRYVVKEHCNTNSIGMDGIQVMNESFNVNLDDSPDEAQLEDQSILELVLPATLIKELQNSRKSLETPSILLKVRHDNRVSLFRMSKTEPFGRLFGEFCKQKGFDAIKTNFLFDGRKLGANENASSLDMEDEDQIDVLFT